jgi:hypothetical protein
MTVSDLHTYYVVAENTSVLVHNCDGLMPGHAQECQCNGTCQNEILEDAGSAMPGMPTTSPTRRRMLPTSPLRPAISARTLSSV